MSNRVVFGIAAAGFAAAVILTKCQKNEPTPEPPPPEYAHTAKKDVFLYRKDPRNNEDILIGNLKKGECVLIKEFADDKAPMGKFIDIRLDTPSGNMFARGAESHFNLEMTELGKSCTANFYQALAVPGEPNEAGLPVVEFYKTIKPAQLYTVSGQPIANRVADTGSCLAIDIDVQRAPVAGYFPIRAVGDDIVHAYVQKGDVEPLRNHQLGVSCRVIFSANIPMP